MMISIDFKNAVNNEDIDLVKIMLKDSLIIDPTGKSFDELLMYAQSNLNNILEQHNDEELNYDRKVWTKEFLNGEMVKLVYNFSSERIEFLKEVCKVVYGNHIEVNTKKRVIVNTSMSRGRRKNKNISRYVIEAVALLVIMILLKSCAF